MLPSIVVDPSTLWLVSADDTLEVAEDAIGRAMEWMKPNTTGPLQLFLSRRSVDALATANAFPAEPRFTDILKTLGLDGVISPKALATTVSRFLSGNRWIEDRVGLQDILYDVKKIAPDPTSVIADPQLQSLSVDALGLSAICASENNLQPLYAFPRQSAAGLNVLVETSIDIADFGEAEARTAQAVNRDVTVLGHPSYWAFGLSASDIWRHSENAEELEVAIWLCAQQLNEQSGCGLKKFRVGTSLFDCLAAKGATGDGPYALSVLQKCAQTVLNQSSLQPNPFYTSAKANASVRERTRDKAKAWRLHVTKSHQALRLMYWELPCGQIEFATLDEKAEEFIHDGEALPRRGW